ncbi:LysR family transcriptional regulator [Solihabitans fulvus]|uniref:LysR family transcriptional regulator n=1 Tax=Solihabitans fulvus TaxID=1892852 RepID=A0A5B2XJL9_9PSEU|nr:LysR family transcriptional regulator [Solihabitans fulvus]KAA2264048.1 LysR family transcriptional regulator [Solihabitans fulvus]
MLDERSQRLVTAVAPKLAMLRALATEQHVTRVAELLGMPQPTVSRWLAALGAELGTPLVVRSGRGVRLTRAGQQLADAAARSLGPLEAGCRRAVEESDPEHGHVVLGFLHLLGRSLVPELVRGFRELHPSVRFRLVQSSNRDVLAQLDSGGVDLALVAPLPVGEPGLRHVPLRQQELLLVVPAAHRLAGRRRVRIAELAEEEFVGIERGYGLRQITDELCAKAGFTPRMTFEGQETETVRGLVAAGLGVAMLPAAEPSTLPGVVELPLTPRAARTIGLVWAAGHPLAPAVRAFRDYARTTRT